MYKLTCNIAGAGSEMGKGDPGMEDIYYWDPVTGPRIAFKGPTGTAGQLLTQHCATLYASTDFLDVY